MQEKSIASLKLSHFNFLKSLIEWELECMAYIRYGTELPSGKSSQSYVIGDPYCLMSFNPDCEAIPYPELITLFKTKTYAQIKRINI